LTIAVIYFNFEFKISFEIKSRITESVV
jgi:hypothetical protein